MTCLHDIPVSTCAFCDGRARAAEREEAAREAAELCTDCGGKGIYDAIVEADGLEYGYTCPSCDGTGYPWGESGRS